MMFRAGKFSVAVRFLKFLENRFVQPAWNSSESAHGTITPGMRTATLWMPLSDMQASLRQLCAALFATIVSRAPTVPKLKRPTGATSRLHQFPKL